MTAGTVVVNEKSIVEANKRALMRALAPSSYDVPTVLEDFPLLPDDRRFLKQCLALLPVNRHEAVLLEYQKRFLEGMASQPLLHKKENTGRYQTNVWLRNLTECRQFQKKTVGKAYECQAYF